MDTSTLPTTGCSAKNYDAIFVGEVVGVVHVFTKNEVIPIIFTIPNWVEFVRYTMVLSTIWDVKRLLGHPGTISMSKMSPIKS